RWERAVSHLRTSQVQAQVLAVRIGVFDPGLKGDVLGHRRWLLRLHVGEPGREDNEDWHKEDQRTWRKGRHPGSTPEIVMGESCGRTTHCFTRLPGRTTNRSFVTNVSTTMPLA